MRHQLTDNVKLLQKAVIVKGNKALILKRSVDSKSRPGCWDLPGGNSEWPKDTSKYLENSYKEDISREILEETGFNVSSSLFVGEKMVYFGTYFEATKQVYTVICGWKVSDISDIDASQVKLSSEHTENTWISLDELVKYDFGGEKGKFIVEMIKLSFS